MSDDKVLESELLKNKVWEPTVRSDSLETVIPLSKTDQAEELIGGYEKEVERLTSEAQKNGITVNGEPEVFHSKDNKTGLGEAFQGHKIDEKLIISLPREVVELMKNAQISDKIRSQEGVTI